MVLQGKHVLGKCQAVGVQERLEKMCVLTEMHTGEEPPGTHTLLIITLAPSMASLLHLLTPGKRGSDGKGLQ